MNRTVRMIRGSWMCWLVVGAAVVAVSPPDSSPLTAQPAKDELAAGLRFVPPDAAFFVHVDATKTLDSTILKSFHKSNATQFDLVMNRAEALFGQTHDKLKSLTLFLPTLDGPQDIESFGLVVTFKAAFDAKKLQKGAEEWAGKGGAVKVVAVDPRTAVVLFNLKDEYAKPQPADANGPLSAALKEAAGGKFAAVMGVNMAALPDELGGDGIPAQLRPFQPLFRARSLTATVDLAEKATLDVRVTLASVTQAAECEKALGALLAMVQGEVTEELQDIERKPVTEASLKDLVAVLKSLATATKAAKPATTGTETRLTVSLPANLPFGEAFLAAQQRIGERVAERRSLNNLKQIALAMHNYAGAQNDNSLPAAVHRDKNGNPLLSWRVTVLPYLEGDVLLDQLKPDEPWDSENNKKLLAKLPKVYSIPGATKIGDTSTHYRVFVDNGAGWDTKKALKFPADFTDGTSNTIMCVTAADAVPWTKPDEITFDPNKDMRRMLGAVANGQAQVAMFDGSVRSLNMKKITQATLNAAITRGAGDILGEDW